VCSFKKQFFLSVAFALQVQRPKAYGAKRKEQYKACKADSKFEGVNPCKRFALDQGLCPCMQRLLKAKILNALNQALCC